MEEFEATKYTLTCVATGREFEDAGWCLEDRKCDTPSLVRASYAQKKLTVRDEQYGLYKFCDWLPVKRLLKGSCAPVTYKSKGLAQKLGLSNLYITFSGYNPRIGRTHEHLLVQGDRSIHGMCQNSRKRETGTGRSFCRKHGTAFAKVCSENNIPLLLCVPYEQQ